jgi:hypothetical protein
MKHFILGLLGLLLTLPRVALMCVAYVIVSIAEQLERLQEWVDTKRGIAITQVGDDDDDFPSTGGAA